MPVFQVGQRVRRIDAGGGDDTEFQVGKVGTVTEIRRPDTDVELVVVVADDGARIILRPMRFALVEQEAPVVPEIVARAYQAGDRVECIFADPWSQVGWVGTVVRINARADPETGLNVLVDWDGGRSLNINQRNIRLVPQAEREGAVFWSVVYKTRGSNKKKVMGFENKREAEDKKREVINTGGQVFATKKLTLRGVN